MEIWSLKVRVTFINVSFTDFTFIFISSVSDSFFLSSLWHVELSSDLIESVLNPAPLLSTILATALILPQRFGASYFVRGVQASLLFCLPSLYL